MTELRRLPAILFVVVALALGGPALAAAQTATAAPGGQLDLAALTLTPADLVRTGLSGFLHDGAFVEPVQGEARSTAAYWGQRVAASDIANQLTADGWQRKYEDNLLKSSVSDPSQPIQVVHSYVTEYADAGGAAAGYAYLEGGPTVPGAQAMTGTRTFGDQSGLTLDRGADSDGRPFRSLDLTFQQGTLVAGVTIVNYPSRTFTDPAVATIEALAAVMAARVAAPPQGGLGSLVQRFAGDVPAVVTYDDAYYRLNGHDIPLTDETASAAAVRIRGYGDAADVYQLWQNVRLTSAASVLFGETLVRFPSAAAAATWLGNLAPELRRDAYYGDLQPQPPPALGAGAAAFRYTAPNGKTDSSVLIAARAGAIAVRVQLIPQGSLPPVPLAAATDLMTAQLACIQAGGCPSPATLPVSLRALAPPASPAATAAPGGA